MVQLSSRRHGFTFVELQVVIAVLAVLVALLLPAVQQTRAAARRLQCQDHLHNIAIAMYDYESVYKTFPPGWVNQVDGHSNFAWGRSLLPFVEQAPLYELIRDDDPLPKQLLDPQKLRGMQTQLDIYRCPNDPSTPLNRINLPTDSNGQTHELALTNYVGNHGGGDWADPPRGYTGIFAMNSRTRIRDITDGTSNTVMCGERSLEAVAGRPKSTCGASVMLTVGGDGEGTIERFALAIGSAGINSAEQLDGQELGVCSEGQSSAHAGGTQVALSDGKVSFLSEEIDPVLLRNLMDRGDGNPVRVP
ncbi:MAG: DUF1559 domain-containing protein [Planctomycetaceae bacterium]